MRQVCVMIALAFAAIGAAPTFAQHTTEFTIAPVGGMRFGDTRFELNFDYLLPDSTLGSGGSELIFPLDMPQAGFQLGFKVMQAGHRAWTADARLLFAVSDPRSKMIDEDWDDTDFGRIEWSSTDSTVDGSLSELDVEITRLFVSGKNAELAVLLGGSYQKVKQRMIDISGSQLGVDTEGNLVIYEFADDELAGTYEIRYLRPQVGLAPRFLWGSVTLEFKGVVSPLLHAKDIDDHVRRSFQIRTDGKGFGYGGRAALQYESSPTTQTRFFAHLSGEISHAEVDMSGFREYYADNPDEGVMRGDLFAEEHTLSSTQYGIHLALGLTF
jgi:outer membrane protease